MEIRLVDDQNDDTDHHFGRSVEVDWSDSPS